VTPALDAAPLHPRHLLILLALHDGPAHGYAILKAVDAESDGEIRFDPANLYRTLRLLEREALVEVVEPPKGGDPRRRTFRLTREGRAALAGEARRVSRLARALRARRLVPERGPDR
jgi:DNA-binding PadR family transcriptional regulator